MSIATGLIAKLLLAVSVIPAAGYGGYCAYDHYNPTFHRFLENEGYQWSPISGDLGTDTAYYQRKSEISKNIGGDWRCSKQLFWDIDDPVANHSDSMATDSENGQIPTTPSDTASSDDYEGCIVADLGHPSSTDKKAAFIKWELALRSGDRGFIYAGYFSIGNIRDINGASEDTISQQSYSTVFEVRKEDGEWNIKHGLNWTDYFSTYDPSDGMMKRSSLENGFSNVEIKVVLPNKEEWTSNGSICALNEGATGKQCPSGDKWTFKKYVGFWEKDEKGEQAIDAIKIAAKENSGEKKEHLHDIWSQTDFDFSTSTQIFKDGQKDRTAWNGSISFIYDVATSKWKRTDAGELPDATEYLKAIYSPWAKKKGKWTEAEKICYESNSRTLKKTDEEAQRLLKFCYQNKK